MLYLTRKPGQSIVINNSIEVTVVEVNGKTVKLGITFPKGATVLRKEIYEKVLQENIMAAGEDVQGDDMDAFLDANIPTTKD